MQRLAQKPLEFLHLFSQELGRLGLHIEAEERLGVALANVEPPVAQVDRDAVEVVDGPLFLVAVCQLSDLGVLVFNLEVDLTRLAVPQQRCDQTAQRTRLAL